jgi:hypothetical protein
MHLHYKDQLLNLFREITAVSFSLEVIIRVYYVDKIQNHVLRQTVHKLTTVL